MSRLVEKIVSIPDVRTKIFDQVTVVVHGIGTPCRYLRGIKIFDLGVEDLHKLLCKKKAATWLT